jgi:hypothetical protein
LCSLSVILDHYEANLTIVKTLKAAVKELRARCTLYSTIRARISASEARRQGSKAAVSEENRTTYLADALLHDDLRPGYAGPGMVSLDCEGTLTLARELPRMVLCLKIYYVYKVNPLWTIPLRSVTDLKSWLDRQFLASQEITPMPKLNHRATTTPIHIWELLAQFDANIQNKSIFVRATPSDLGDRLAIVEASVITQTRLKQAMDGPQGTRQRLTDDSKTFSYLRNQNGHAADDGGDGNLCSQKADMSLLCENQAQQAEITRLNRSIMGYGTRMRAANVNIRTLKNELRDSLTQNSELQDRYNKVKQEAEGLFLKNAGDKVSLPPLTQSTMDVLFFNHRSSSKKASSILAYN